VSADERALIELGAADFAMGDDPGKSLPREASCGASPYAPPPAGVLATTVAPFPQALKPIAATSTVKHDPSLLVTVFIFSLLMRKRGARPDLTAGDAISTGAAKAR
jgi:hypothetical protein